LLIVDQRPGGRGAIATEIVAKSNPDGYTWLISTATHTINAGFHPDVQSSLESDFAPVMLLATAAYYLLVHPSVPAKSVAELVEYARAKPGQLNYSTSGIGSPPHLAAELLKIMARINIVHVPYKSSATATTDLLGGHVQVSFQYAPTAMPHVQSGKLRLLAVTGVKRSLMAPEFPTVAESGFPGFEVLGWNGVHVPKGTPKQIIARINKDTLEVLKLPDVRNRMLNAGLEPVGTTPEEFGVFVKTNLAHWIQLIKQTGIHAE
ncbi:MAG: tripartite tricarboxylate transporter substrate binding protein, partial [Betaproteobacteria bacterium]|nr:tripartite tricarboxylate transporter substrate binding protein [Betaproteobacteria bacterium]